MSDKQNNNANEDSKGKVSPVPPKPHLDGQKIKKASNSNTHPMKELYLDLFEVVKYTLGTNINKEKIEKTIFNIIEGLEGPHKSQLLLYSYTESKDNYLISHISNCVILSLGFGNCLGISKNDLMELGICAFCHDFGMTEYTHIFQKGHQLTEEENRLIQEHPTKSAEMFSKIFHQKIITGILDVHENANGQGYPKGKTAQEISFLAKIISICDVFEALTHSRNFRHRYNPYEAIKLIIDKRDTMFEKKVLKKFVEFMSIYPIGCLVYLNTGETGIVIDSNPGYPTKSIVKVLLTPKREVDNSEKILNLLEDPMVYILGVVASKEEREILHFLKPRGDIHV